MLTNAGSATLYNWYMYRDSNGTITCVNLTSAHYLAEFSYPSQYTRAYMLCQATNTGTAYISQSVTFPVDGTYVLTLWAAPRGLNLYNTSQTLSAFIDSTQVITNWTGVGSSGAAIASLLTSIPFTVTAGSHTLKIQSYAGPTYISDTTIAITGININSSVI